MKNLYNIPKMISVLTLLSLGACSSAPFKVTSSPEQAEVYIVNPDTKTEKKIGVTPLTKKKKELVEQLGDQAQAGSLVNVVVKKDGYRSKEIWLPVAAGGHIPTALNLTLETSTSKSSEMRTAGDIMDKIFLAQQFANTKQLERAIIEIDKVLEEFPKFDRAMTMKAAILFAQKNMKESLKWYESALDINPELKSAIEMSGRIRKTLRLPARSSARVPASRRAKAKL